MRTILIFLPAVLLAQTPAPKAQPAPAAAPKAAPAKPATAAAPATKGTPAPAPKAAPTPMTDDQKTIYALGLTLYKSIDGFNLSAAELDILKRALSDAKAGKPAVDLDTYGPKINSLASARQKAVAKAYQDKAAAEPGAIKTESGLIYRELTAGTGDSPKATDTVKVHYRGTLTNGTEFDSSYKRNAPASFPLNQVIKCWTEGVQKMKVGGKARLVCPSDIAYGDNGRPPQIPGGATLVFEVELLEIGG